MNIDGKKNRTTPDSNLKAITVNQYLCCGVEEL